MNWPTALAIFYAAAALTLLWHHVIAPTDRITNE